MVVEPWRRARKLDLTYGSCVAPLWLGGLRGKQSTPSDWLGGIGVVSTVGERERHRAHSTLFDVDNKATVWVFVLDRIGCFTIYVGIRTWVVNGLMAVLFIYSANVIKI